LEEDELSFSFSVDRKTLEMCEFCFVDDGSSLKIFAFEELVGETFDVEIVVEDADHATHYEFKVTVSTPPEPEPTKEEIAAEAALIAEATAEEFSELKGYEPKTETGF